MDSELKKAIEEDRRALDRLFSDMREAVMSLCNDDLQRQYAINHIDNAQKNASWSMDNKLARMEDEQEPRLT